MKRWMWALIIGGALAIGAGCGNDRVVNPVAVVPADTCGTDEDD